MNRCVAGNDLQRVVRGNQTPLAAVSAICMAAGPCGMGEEEGGGGDEENRCSHLWGSLSLIICGHAQGKRYHSVRNVRQDSRGEIQ